MVNVFSRKIFLEGALQLEVTWTKHFPSQWIHILFLHNTYNLLFAITGLGLDHPEALSQAVVAAVAEFNDESSGRSRMTGKERKIAQLREQDDQKLVNIINLSQFKRLKLKNWKYFVQSVTQ